MVTPYFIQDENGEPIPIRLLELEIIRNSLPIYVKFNEDFLDIDRSVDVFLPTGRLIPINDTVHPSYLSQAEPIRQLIHQGEVNFHELNRLFALAKNLNLLKIDDEYSISIVNDFKYRNIVTSSSQSKHNSWEIPVKTYDNIDMIKRVAKNRVDNKNG